jgi:hypothetical protein
MNTSSLIDIIRLLATIDNSTTNYRAIKWLKKINLIQNLIALFANAKNINNKNIASVYCNVSQAICDLIKITREQTFNIICDNNTATTMFTTGINNNNNNNNMSEERTPSEQENSNDEHNEVNKEPTGPLDINTLVKNSILENIER